MPNASPYAAVVGETINANQDYARMLHNALVHIVNLYADHTHFVYELIQNAEDVGATTLRFELYPDRIEFFHDGRPFSEQDLCNLCDVGNSDKWVANATNQIGEFGIGFKSVFTICKEVYLYSDPRGSEWERQGEYKAFAIRIHDFVHCEDITPGEMAGYTTRFVFPFAVKSENVDGALRDCLTFETTGELHQRLLNHLENLGVSTLLFLHHIKSIEYEVHFADAARSVRTGCHLVDKTAINDHCFIITSLGEKGGNAEQTESFVVFERPATMPPGSNVRANKTIDLAFRIKQEEDGAWTFLPMLDALRVFFLYFPTEEQSNLNFIVQAPFRTPPTRANLVKDDKDNTALLGQAAQLLRESILELRDMGKLSLDLLLLLPFEARILPLKSLARTFYDETCRLFEKEQIWPCEEGGFTTANNGYLASPAQITSLFRGPLLTEFLNVPSPGIQFHWLTREISGSSDRTRALHQFLTRKNGNLSLVRLWELADVCKELDKNTAFLAARDEDWLVDFYNLLETQPAEFTLVRREARLLTCHLFKTTSGTFESAYVKTQQGDLVRNLFLPFEGAPCEQKGLNIIDPVFCRRCSTFFNDVLRLTPPDTYDRLVSRLKLWYATPEKAQTVALDTHIGDIRGIARLLGDPTRKDDMAATVRDLYVIRCKDRQGPRFERPFADNLFVPVTADGRNIESYLFGIDNGRSVFVDWEAYEQAGVTQDMLALLGVRCDIVQGMEKEGWGLPGKKGRPTNWCAEGDFRLNLTLCYLDEALADIDLYRHNRNTAILAEQKSIVLLRTLEAHAQRLQGTLILKATNQRREAEARALTTLRETPIAWLYSGRQDKWVRPGDCTRDELTERYGVPLDNALAAGLLGFQQSQADRQKALKDKYRDMTEDERFMLAEIILEERFGVKAHEVEDVIREIGRRRAFTFPNHVVRNMEALRDHVRRVALEASPVTYETVIRTIRRGDQPKETREHIQSFYKIESLQDNRTDYACQMCHRRVSNFEACQLLEKPECEWHTLHLCLCPNCAAYFRKLCKKPTYDAFLERLRTFTQTNEAELYASKPIHIELDDREIWFAQTHLAEISVLLQQIHGYGQ